MVTIKQISQWISVKKAQIRIKIKNIFGVKPKKEQPIKQQFEGRDFPEKYNFYLQWIKPHTIVLMRKLAKAGELDLAPLTGVFAAIIMMSTGIDWKSSLIWGIFGYFIYIRVEESFIKYAKSRRNRTK